MQEGQTDEWTWVKLNARDTNWQGHAKMDSDMIQLHKASINKH